jgi:putative sterol carrier protein
MLESIPERVSAQQLRGVNNVVEIRSAGADAGRWRITVKNGECAVERDASLDTMPLPDLVVEASSDVWQSLITRKLDPEWAYMSGQIRISGDLGLAMRLQSLLRF